MTLLMKDGKTKIYAWLLLREKDTWRYTFKQIETHSLASRWPSPCPNQGSELIRLLTFKLKNYGNKIIKQRTY